MLTASDDICCYFQCVHSVQCSLMSSRPVQRYSVAVYLVRVFTSAELFSQLKHCSVESAERCRERSKWPHHFSFMLYCILVMFTPVLCDVELVYFCCVQSRTSYALIQRTRSPPQGYGCPSSVLWGSALSPQAIFTQSCFHFLLKSKSQTFQLLLTKTTTRGTGYHSPFVYSLMLITYLPFLFLLSASEDADRSAVSGAHLCPLAVFRCHLLPANEWEEAHVDLPRVWQTGSLWAAHHWWVSKACWGLSLTNSTTTTHSPGIWEPLFLLKVFAWVRIFGAISLIPKTCNGLPTLGYILHPLIEDLDNLD